MNDSTVFDDVADGILVAAKLINDMLPPVNNSITNITLSLDDDDWCWLQNSDIAVKSTCFIFSCHMAIAYTVCWSISGLRADCVKL